MKKYGCKDIVIPDIQAKPGVALDHCRWIGRYIAEQKPDNVIQLGDLADFESLSSYDRGKKDFEGRRFKEDLKAAAKACSLLVEPLYNSRTANQCETHILLGNHEERADRFAETNPEMEGFVGSDQLAYEDYFDNVYSFLEVTKINGVSYSHYFYNPLSGRPWGGQIQTIIKNVGFSFTAGHRQGRSYTTRTLADGTEQHGLIAGSCYLHTEKYLGPQCTKEWRGIIVKHECKNGMYDPMFVSLNYLCRKYEKKDIPEFLKSKYGRVDGRV